MSCRLFLSPSIYRTKNISILLLLIPSKRRWQKPIIYRLSPLRSGDSGIRLLEQKFATFFLFSLCSFGEYISFLSWRNNDTTLSWVRVDQDLCHFRSLERFSECSSRYMSLILFRERQIDFLEKSLTLSCCDTMMHPNIFLEWMLW